MYPRTITLESAKLLELLKAKAELVEQGRFKSEEIEETEKSMAEIEQSIIAEEKKVDISDFNDQSVAITNRFNDVVKEMDTLKKRIYDRMRENTSQALRDSYEAARVKKLELEEQRNKVALKIQQKNDKVIPLTQKLMKSEIQNEFEDYDTVRLENGKVIATIFSHLEDFKNRHLSKSKK